MTSKQPDTDRIAITGIGLVTSLGVSAASSLAAILSGIANFVEHETVMVNGNEYGTELNGAFVARLPEQVLSRHVHGADRMAALVAPAIRECLTSLSQGILENLDWRISCGAGAETGSFVGKLRLELSSLNIPVRRIINTADPEAARCLFFENIMRAVVDLRNGACQAALVGCVDSLCDTETLEYLAENDRLKSGTNPEGIIAGEAAGVILLEPEYEAVKRNAVIHARINAWGRGHEPNPWTGSQPSSAAGLTNAFHEAFAPLPDKGTGIVTVFADLNGERARAHEWGLTSGRIFPVDDTPRELLHPADCAGDCGDAMGAVLLVTALGLMPETPQPVKCALSTSDDNGARRVLCLENGGLPDQDALMRDGQEKCPVVLTPVLEQHSDEAPFLWLLRNRLTIAPNCGLHDLARHDRRLQAHLDGLRLAGESGWLMSQEALRHGNAGDLFAASYLAFTSGDEDRISALLHPRYTSPGLSKGIISALGWLSRDQAMSFIKRLLAAPSPALLRIGIAASAIHRIDPGKHLDDAMRSEDPVLKARGLKAAGELGRIDLLPNIVEHFSHHDEACRFRAAWSAALLGNRDAIAVFRSLSELSMPYREESARMAFRLFDTGEALELLELLAATQETIRAAVMGAGASGDPAHIPWLIEQMRVEELARVAGEAFALITGVDIALDGLGGENPYEFDDDADDDDMAIDLDENLPWPDSELVAGWWRHRRNVFVDGARYFLGKTMSAGHLRQVLSSGSQRQRMHAAIELKILNPGLPLFETRAPGFRQIPDMKG